MTRNTKDTDGKICSESSTCKNDKTFAYNIQNDLGEILSRLMEASGNISAKSSGSVTTVLNCRSINERLE